MKILIVRVSAIGDVIHTLPAVLYIKKSIPNAHISWIIQEKAKDLIENQPFLDNIFTLPNNFLKYKNIKQTIKTIHKLRTINWDLIIDFQGLIKTSLLYCTLKGKKFGFDKYNTKERLTHWFNSYKIKPMYTHIIQKNLALASGVVSHIIPNTTTCPSINNLKKDFKLFIPKEKISTVDNWLEKKEGEKYVLIAPNTTWPSKHWSLSHWKTFIQKIIANKKISVILVGKDFGSQAQKLADFIKSKSLTVKLVPKWDLLTITHLIQTIDLLIAPDTGLLHLADFLGTKSIGLFGPTHKSKHGPFLTKENSTTCIQIKCPHTYQKTHGKIDCMKRLSPEELLQIVLLTLNK